MTDRITNTANNFKTTLSADMGSTGLTATVVTTTGAPSSPCLLVIDANDPAKREVIYFDGTFTGTTFVTTALGNRYLQGSAFASGINHVTGAEVTQTALAQHVTDLNDRITADETVNASHRTGTPNAHHNQLHAATHNPGGGDSLTGNLDAVARAQVKSAGTLISTRRGLNFLAGTGIVLGVGDDAANEEAEITITGHAENHASRHNAGGADALSGSLDATARVQTRINSGGTVPVRRRINFIEGTGIDLAIADDAANEESDVTITATATGLDHGGLTGLGDDDHTSYLTHARHKTGHQVFYAQGTVDLTLTTVAQNITSATVTVTPARANANFIVTLDMDFDVQASGGGFAFGRITLDGNAQGPEITLGASAVGLWPCSRSVAGGLPNASQAYVFRAAAFKQAAGGTIVASGARCSLTVRVVD